MDRRDAGLEGCDVRLEIHTTDAAKPGADANGGQEPRGQQRVDGVSPTAELDSHLWDGQEHPGVRLPVASGCGHGILLEMGLGSAVWRVDPDRWRGFADGAHPRG
jgi:hypothetical protein